MTITDGSVGASSPDGRMFRLDLGGVDEYAAGDFVTIAEESGPASRLAAWTRLSTSWTMSPIGSKITTGSRDLCTRI